MYNYLMLIGTVTKDIELRETTEGKIVTNLDLAVTREYKNVEGGYDCDFIRVQLWGFLAEMANESLSKGSRVGIKGRIYPHMEQLASGAFVPINELIAERLLYFDKATNTEKEISAEEEINTENNN